MDSYKKTKKIPQILSRGLINGLKVTNIAALKLSYFFKEMLSFRLPGKQPIQ